MNRVNKVDFVDLAAQYEQLRDKINKASDMLISSVAELEDALV